jgi:hypothetical protein
MIRTAHFLFQFRSTVAPKHVAWLFVTLAVYVMLAPPMHATAIATGSIQVTNFTITPASGTVVFSGLWTAQAFAEAQNSFSCCDSQFSSSAGGIAQADAMVTFAQAHSLTDASALTLSAADAANIPFGVIAASTIGQGDLSNTFMITGGTGTVNVTFSALVSFTQVLFTDASGVFAMDDTSYQLTIDGQTVLFMDASNQIGPNSSFSISSSGTSTDSMTLNFGESYFVDSYAQDDPNAYNMPEPPSGSLLLLGATLLAAQRVFVTLRG